MIIDLTLSAPRDQWGNKLDRWRDFFNRHIVVKPPSGVICLDSWNGDDNNSGDTPECAVKTLDRAMGIRKDTGKQISQTDINQLMFPFMSEDSDPISDNYYNDGVG